MPPCPLQDDAKSGHVSYSRQTGSDDQNTRTESKRHDFRFSPEGMGEIGRTLGDFQRRPQEFIKRDLTVYLEEYIAYLSSFQK